ncbi:MAG: hypothetical protein H0U27_06540 [Nitrosopumilus sp.]|nr:hypothetical protein [Nitrosopumilus sp.]
MSNSKFNKAPLTLSEKEKKAEEFIGFIDKKTTSSSNLQNRQLEKELMKTFHLRLPLSLYDDLREITALTGISINSVCLELLRPGIKKKLKEIKDSEY